jgi:putative acetyltransferase
VRRGLETAERLGESVVVVLGHPEYYPRFGFRPALPMGIRPPYPVEMVEAWMVLGLTPDGLEELRGVVRFGAPLMDERNW